MVQGVDTPADTHQSSRILLAHTDAKIRDLLSEMLAAAGLQVHSAEPTPEALRALAGEHFSLAVIGVSGPTTAALDLFPILREGHATLPMVLLVSELDFSVVQRGIRVGLAEVLPLRDDPQPVVRRLLRLAGVETDHEPTRAELAGAEAALAQLEPDKAETTLDPETRAQRESLWQGLRDLHLEHELLAAAQAGLDERARLLREDRERLQADRRTLVDETAAMQAEGEELEREWAKLAAQQRAQVREHENLNRLESDLRSREQTIAETIPPIPVVKELGGARELEAEWDQLERARAAFDAERAIFRDERMALVDLDRQIREREARVRELGEQIADLDRRRRGLPPPPPAAFAKTETAAASGSKPGFLKGLLGGRKTAA